MKIENKKAILSFLCSIFITFFFCRSAYADAVYLKNGKVMTGKIVEKTENYIVLKTGEGDTEVRSTIFLDDILRIQDQEQYTQETLETIRQLVKTEFLRKAATENPFYRQLSLPTDTGAADIRNMIIEDRRIQAVPKKVKEMSSEAVSAEPSVAAPSLPAPPGISLPEPEGSIEGVVRLPSPVFQKNRGNLLIFLMERQEKNGQDIFFAGLKMRYELIDAKNISAPQVRYKIEHIPSGDYRVFAQWDIALGAIEPRETANQVPLVGLWGKGDYSGSSETVSLRDDEHREDVNFDCKTLIEKDYSMDDPEQLMDFQIVDLYYRDTPVEEPQFLVLIKNNNQASLVSIAFDVYVNDEKVFQEPMAFGPFQPNEEKEFDITSAYKEYKKIFEGRGGVGVFMSKSMKFRLVWTLSKDVSFEKTLFLF